MCLKGRRGGGRGHKKPASLTFGKFNFIGKESPRTPLLYYAPKDNSIPLKRKKAFKHTKSNVSLGKKITNSVSHFSFSFLLFFGGGVVSQLIWDTGRGGRGQNSTFEEGGHHILQELSVESHQLPSPIRNERPPMETK